MRVIAALIVISCFSGCAVGPTGVVGSDGHTVYWNQGQPENQGSQVVQTLLQAGGRYCTGYANTYNSTPHGQAMVFSPGGKNSFIYW